jgi:hypothetical protein
MSPVLLSDVITEESFINHHRYIAYILAKKEITQIMEVPPHPHLFEGLDKNREMS